MGMAACIALGPLRDFIYWLGSRLLKRHGTHAKGRGFLWRIKLQIDFAESPHHPPLLYLFLSTSCRRRLWSYRSQCSHGAEKCTHGMAPSHYRRGSCWGEGSSLGE